MNIMWKFINIDYTVFHLTPEVLKSCDSSVSFGRYSVSMTLYDWFLVIKQCVVIIYVSSAATKIKIEVALQK